MKKQIIAGSLVALFLMALVFFYVQSPKTVAKDETSTNQTAEILSTEEVAEAWSYTGSTGPNSWGDLSPNYILAKEGKEQSPINIETDKVKELEEMGDIQSNYVPTAFEVENNGHTIECIPKTKENHMVLDDKTYYLAQFHFHSSSEHELDGERTDMEVHFVFQTEEGNTSVIGVFIKEEGENAVLKELFDHMPRQVTTEEEMYTLENKINISDLIPENSKMFRYSGSLTTPPVTEGVQWVVYQDSLGVSGDQINTFKSIYSDNYRPVQPLNDREVIQYQK